MRHVRNWLWSFLLLAFCTSCAGLTTSTTVPAGGSYRLAAKLPTGWQAFGNATSVNYPKKAAEFQLYQFRARIEVGLELVAESGAASDVAQAAFDRLAASDIPSGREHITKTSAWFYWASADKKRGQAAERGRYLVRATNVPGVLLTCFGTWPAKEDSWLELQWRSICDSVTLR